MACFQGVLSQGLSWCHKARVCEPPEVIAKSRQSCHKPDRISVLSQHNFPAKHTPVVLMKLTVAELAVVLVVRRT